MIYSTCERTANYISRKALLKGYEEKHKDSQHALRQPGFDAVIGDIPGWYVGNFLSLEYAACFGGFSTQPDPEGYLAFASPYLDGPGKVPWIFGDMIHGTFLDTFPYHRQIVHYISDTITFPDMARHQTQPGPRKAPLEAKSEKPDAKLIYSPRIL